MARKRPTKTDSPEAPQVTAIQGLSLLEKQISKAEELLSNQPLSRDEYSTWEMLTRNHLEKAFGRNSTNVSSVMDVGRYGRASLLSLVGRLWV